MKHKLNLFLLLLLVAGIGYAYYQNRQASTDTVRYVTAPIQRGLMVAAVAGTGQVLSDSQLDIKPKISGTVAILPVKEGDHVIAGQLIAHLDDVDARKNVRDAQQVVVDAQIAVDAARLSLTKLKKPATVSAVTLAQDAVAQAQRDLDKLQAPPNAFDVASAQAEVDSAQQNLKMSADGKLPQIVRNSYDTTVSTLASSLQTAQVALLDSDSVLGIDNTGANLAFQQFLSSLDSRAKSQAAADYPQAKAAIQAAKDLVANLAAHNEDPANVDRAAGSLQTALDKTYSLLGDVIAVLVATPASASYSQTNIDALKATIQTDRSNINAKVSGLIAQLQTNDQTKTTFATAATTMQKAQAALDKLKQPPEARDIASAKEKIIEKQQALIDLQNGADVVDIAMTQNTIDQKVSALRAAKIKVGDAQTALSDYAIVAPFDGILAKLPIQRTDVVSSATVAATLASNKKIAQVALNEIDAAKAKVGQKATLTFDAIDGLGISGDVVSIDTIGTVTQGVVNYNVKIAFDTQDPRIKSGMSVRATIIIATKNDTLFVPTAAVKTQNGQSTVDVLPNNASSTTATPERRQIQIGIANDSNTEIIAGANAGELVVTQTIHSAAGSKTTGQTNAGGLRIPGMSGGGGGFRPGGGFRGN